MSNGKVIRLAGEREPEPAREPLAPSRRRVLEGELFDAHRAAQDLLREAEVERDRLLAEAGRERERLHAEARERGRQEGLAQVTELLVRARVAAGRELERSQRELVPLAVRIAERCVGAALASAPALVADQAAQAVEQLRRAQAVVVRVHPETLAALDRDRLLSRIGRSLDVVLKADPGVERVGCIVESDCGTVDAQLSTQLAVIAAVLDEDGGGPDAAG